MGGFFPTEPFGPRSEEVTEGVAGAVLAFGPRHLFDFYAAAWAIDSTHGVEKIDGNVPKRDEGEASLFERVVAWARFGAGAATGFTIGARANEGLDSGLLSGLNQLHGLINETLEWMNEVE